MLLAHQPPPDVIKGFSPASPDDPTRPGPLGKPAAFSPSGRALAIVGEDDAVRLWDVELGSMSGRFEAGLFCPAADDPDLSQTETYLAFSPDGATLAGTCGSQIVVWDVATRHVRRVIESELSGISDLKLSANAVGTGGLVKLWDLASGEPLPAVGVGAFAISPDGKVAASAHAGGAGNGGDGLVVWDVATGQVRGEMTEASLGGVVELTFAHDGSTLAVGSPDGSVTLWDTKSFQPIGPPLEGLQLPTSIEFTSDGRSLSVAGLKEDISNGSERLPSLLRWDLAVDHWVDEACAISNRNLTRAEWTRFLGTTAGYRKTCPGFRCPNSTGWRQNRRPRIRSNAASSKVMTVRSVAEEGPNRRLAVPAVSGLTDQLGHAFGGVGELHDLDDRRWPLDPTPPGRVRTAANWARLSMTRGRAQKSGPLGASEISIQMAHASSTQWSTARSHLKTRRLSPPIRDVFLKAGNRRDARVQLDAHGSWRPSRGGYDLVSQNVAEPSAPTASVLHSRATPPSEASVISPRLGRSRRPTNQAVAAGPAPPA